MSKGRKSPAKLTRKQRYYRHLNSGKWQRIRHGALVRADFRCNRCGSAKRLEVHHKTYRNLGNEKPEDLEVLCRWCHREHHRREKVLKLKQRRRAAYRKSRGGHARNRTGVQAAE